MPDSAACPDCGCVGGDECVSPLSKWIWVALLPFYVVVGVALWRIVIMALWLVRWLG